MLERSEKFLPLLVSLCQVPSLCSTGLWHCTLQLWLQDRLWMILIGSSNLWRWVSKVFIVEIFILLNKIFQNMKFNSFIRVVTLLSLFLSIQRLVDVFVMRPWIWKETILVDIFKGWWRKTWQSPAVLLIFSLLMIYYQYFWWEGKN